MAVGVQRTTSSPSPARERVELILGQLDQLPTLPTVVARLLAVAGSDDSSACDLVRIIEPDPSLTARILRMVRRADLGVRTEGMTVARAVTLLGFRAVRNAALSTQFFETLSAPGEDQAATTRRKGLWKHSLAIACAAEMIAERTDAPSAGDAFVCGLLHDIGKIALDVCLPKSYARVLDRSERQPVCLCDIEQDILGVDHTTAGKRLVTRWRLGQPIVECVWLHHQDPDALPSNVAHPRMVRIVHVADALVRRAGIGASGSGHPTDIETAALPLGLDRHALDQLVQRVPERMKPLQEALGVDDDGDGASNLESLSEANRRLGQLNVQLVESNRVLQLRSDCLDALTAFTGRLAEDARVADVCAAAADAVRAFCRVDRAVAFLRQHGSRFIHFGVSDKLVLSLEGSEAAPRTAIVDCGDFPAIDDVDSTRGMVAAPERCEDLWQRCFGSPAEAPLWMLPIHTDAAAGGVLIVADDRVVRPLRSAAAECGSLAAAIRLAVSSAAARVDAEKTAEELLDLNRRLHTAQKQLVRMRSISIIAQMAAGAAHELNNPLAVISGRAQMELARSEDPEPCPEPRRSRRALEIIIEQAQRASGIVSDLMSFAKPAEPRPVVQPLADVLEAACQHWRRVSELGPNRLVLSIRDTDSTVCCDPDQLREILQAVFANALEATDPAARRIEINSPSRASDETVRIVVEDNGVGMTPDVLEHALDPFFSSRAAGRGRGLGLSRAYRLAEINGGSLWLESTPNIATTVTIELPARAPAS
jgi:signal transduction histidine kinase/HD-like signal output (HDOD) protein